MTKIRPKLSQNGQNWAETLQNISQKCTYRHTVASLSLSSHGLSLSLSLSLILCIGEMSCQKRTCQKFKL